jgi:hypothetical protein
MGRVLFDATEADRSRLGLDTDAGFISSGVIVVSPEGFGSYVERSGLVAGASYSIRNRGKGYPIAGVVETWGGWRGGESGDGCVWD